MTSAVLILALAAPGLGHHGATYASAQVPGKVLPAPQAPSKIVPSKVLPCPQAPSKVVPSKVLPAPQAPIKSSPQW